MLDCGHEPTKTNGFGTGYGTDKDGKTHCYQCCANLDREQLTRDGAGMLYLSKDDQGWKVGNWPGTLEFRTGTPRKGRHNIARTRYDVWFRFDGSLWHGVQYGEMTQVCHVKRTREAA